MLSDIASRLAAERAGLQRLLTLIQARTMREVAVTDVHRLAHLGFEYLQALFGVGEVHLTVFRPSDVLVPEYELTEDFHAFLTARIQPSDSKRALPSVLLRHERCQDADRV